MNNLIHQAVDRKNRFSPVRHVKLSVGDVVLIKDDMVKPSKYPLGIVRNVVENSKGEITDVTVFKGKTNELLKRRVTSIIPLISNSTEVQAADEESQNPLPPTRPVRATAKISRAKTKAILSN